MLTWIRTAGSMGVGDGLDSVEFVWIVQCFTDGCGVSEMRAFSTWDAAYKFCQSVPNDWFSVMHEVPFDFSVVAFQEAERIHKKGL